MEEASLSEVRRLVDAANAARQQSDASGDAERWLDAHFRTGHTLAVYGTLAPGQPNHHVLAPLGGEWTDGLIEGDLIPLGWGAALGYPGFRPRAGGATGGGGGGAARAPGGGGGGARLTEGGRLRRGGGAALGSPGFRPRAGGDTVEVKVLNAPSL